MNVSVVRFKFRCNMLISGKIIKEIPGSVASETHCSIWHFQGLDIRCVFHGWLNCNHNFNPVLFNFRTVSKFLD